MVDFFASTTASSAGHNPAHNEAEGDCLACHELPGRWAGRDRFVMLETAFGDGSGFLTTWAAWRNDPQRCSRLHYIAIAPLPPAADQLARVDREASLQPIASQLVSAWPPPTPNIHRLVFEQGRVELLLVVGELVPALRELIAEVDAFSIDATAATTPSGEVSRTPKWLGRLAATGATAVFDAGSDAAFRAALRSAGFTSAAAMPVPRPAGRLVAKFAPRFTPARPPARRSRPVPDGRRHALIIGAGLAGCATAAALAEQGWTSSLIDRHDGPAAEASGNSAGLFHGVVHAHDGHHARFNRAAALEAARCFAQLQASHTGQPNWLGGLDGLLRLGSDMPDIAAMASLLRGLHLPPEHVRAVDPAGATVLAGLPIESAAWFFPRGGWLRPARLAQAWLGAAGEACEVIYRVEVDSIQQMDGSWAVFDRSGGQIAKSPHLILANAGGAPRLLDQLAGRPTQWPLQRVRGQTSQIDLSELPGQQTPRIPLTGAGYLLPAVDGQLVFGATAQADDPAPEVRHTDHQQNMARLASLSPALQAVDQIDPDRFAGRTSWRCVADDRLPLIGAVPHLWAGGPVGGPDGAVPDQPRFVSRRDGLYLFIGLGSRGITWAPLGARLLAGILSGAPLPLEAGLVDAIDPARFPSRASRRQAAQTHGA